jgi:secretion/DNA translocation related TadE-like protein
MADRGSASIWVLVCSAVVLLVGVAASLRTTAVLARHRAESAADFAALAAAGRIGVAADSCTVARSIAAANGALLVRCRTILAADGRNGTVDVTISVTVHLAGLTAQRVVATARAGRLPASTESDMAPWPTVPAAEVLERAEAREVGRGAFAGEQDCRRTGRAGCLG